jgi:hypothetical protein
LNSPESPGLSNNNRIRLDEDNGHAITDFLAYHCPLRVIGSRISPAQIEHLFRSCDLKFDRTQRRTIPANTDSS